MLQKPTYPNIDMQQTGKKMKHMLETAGYTPRMLQDYLHLSCVQPIYRWYKGVILPSVDHLFMLSELLGVHMEELLVKKSVISWIYEAEWHCPKNGQGRIVQYYNKIKQAVA